MTRGRHRWSCAVCAVAMMTACDVAADAAPVGAPAVRATRPAPVAARGRLHTVRMLLDNEGFRFEPAYVTVAEGDGVIFRMISGVPHNVAFDERFIPAGSRAQLASNLAAIGARDLAAPVVTTIDSTYVVSTAGLPKGDYLFYCAPHRSLNMHGVITVR